MLYINFIFYTNSFQTCTITQNCSIVPREASLAPRSLEVYYYSW